MVTWGLMPAAEVPIFVIAAMAGYFAGISKAPFTAILLITEMVGTLHHLMPLAIVSLIAYMTVDILGGAPVYAAMLDRLLQHRQQTQTTPLKQISFPVFVESSLAGKQVREVNWPQGALLVELQRGEKVLIPHGDTIIRVGDLLVLNVESRTLRAVRQAMKQLVGD
jgi:hypothetical protein